MWVDYRGPLSTVYNDGEISPPDGVHPWHVPNGTLVEHTITPTQWARPTR